MEQHNPPPRDKDLWEDLRDTVREGVRGLRDAGDELARQARLRMDIFQTERRLRAVYGKLGEVVFQRLSENQPVTADDVAISELTARIGYYSDELGRLRREQQQTETAGR